MVETNDERRVGVRITGVQPVRNLTRLKTMSPLFAGVTPSELAKDLVSHAE